MIIRCQCAQLSMHVFPLGIILIIQVHYKTQQRVSRVYICNQLIRTKCVQIQGKMPFFLEPNSSAQLLFSSQSQWSILPIFVD